MSSPRARILYIDDDAALCRQIQKDLERRGHVVEVRTDGVSGLARIVQGGIDLVALDHFMPGQDGMATLALIGALADPPPVIYVTAMQDGKVAVLALKSGAADYVAKDVEGEFFELLQRAIVAAIDATALRRAKEAGEAENKLIVDTIRDPLVVLEHDMTILSANKTFLTIFGITEEMVRGRHIFDLGQRQWDVPALHRLLDKVILEDTPIESFEIEDDFPSLGRRVFNLNARKIARLGNHVHRMLVVFEDITDRKQRERDAQMLTNEVSHRIKNNLQLIIGLMSYESRLSAVSSAEVFKALQSRISAIAQLYDLISHSSLGGTIAVDECLREIAKTMSASLLGASSNIKIEVKAAALEIDHNRAVPFGLLVNELATNAIKHAFPLGIGRVVFGAEQIGDQIELTVTDDGVGMQDNGLEKITEKRGANYVAIFVRQLGGSISKTGIEGSGTTVTIRFPMCLTASGGAALAA